MNVRRYVLQFCLLILDSNADATLREVTALSSITILRTPVDIWNMIDGLWQTPLKACKQAENGEI